MVDRGYRAFLSYSHRDETWAQWLYRALEKYQIDKSLVGRDTPAGAVPATLRPIFRYRKYFPAQHSLTEQTLAALMASKFLVVVCSPHAAQSKYVNEEILRFKAIAGSDRVIAIIVDGEPGDPGRECLPVSLRFKVGPDGTLTGEPEEPIAVDARHHGDGRRVALQKVIAGLLGVPFNDVRKRVLVARNRDDFAANIHEHMDMLIGWVRDSLKLSGKTQKGIADALKRQPSAVTRLLQGKRKLKTHEISKIAEYLGVPPPAYADVNPVLIHMATHGLATGLRLGEELVDHIDGAVAASADAPPPQDIRVVGYVGVGAQAHYYAVAQGDLDTTVTKNVSNLTVAVEVKGSSLGELFDRWLVFYDDVRAPVTSDEIGKLCIIGLADGRVVIKKITRGRNGRFILRPNVEEPIEEVDILWAARITHMQAPP